MFESFGEQAPANLSRRRHPTLWLIAFCFVLASVLILAVINFFGLFFGVTVRLLGRDGVKFNFIQLFGRIPLIGITVPLLFGYAIFHNVKINGAMTAILPSILTTTVAVALLGAIIYLNNKSGAQIARRSKA
ncbi:hypothetical protein; putative membrane protein; putative permease [Pseudorhizobium banfieldiae]|uniref:Uncharacterized protein n=1 Tax=Pseudorhizobium banfieldiae TaxID=1125847 RepID=L0NB74_9HYPH|nr:hypothetical protein [Pseudorhizobium banfieldiae]CAD6601892.1 hypothetical protein RNT25_00983 [arsenite-oxidising bacterium NT-25]CCF18310.1 hypothetical protein; putative membrane protein; putative permease [Pseudorhizobium banfieldiae]